MITGFANYLQIQDGKVQKQVMTTKISAALVVGSTEASLGRQGKPPKSCSTNAYRMLMLIIDALAHRKSSKPAWVHEFASIEANKLDKHMMLKDNF